MKREMMWHRPWIMSHFPSWETPWQNPDLPVAHAVPNLSLCHWAPRLALPSPKPRDPLCCLGPGSMAEGEPKIALQQLGWPLFSAAPALQGERQIWWGMELVPALSRPETRASKDDSQERLGTGSLLPCCGCWLMGDPEALGSYG